MTSHTTLAAAGLHGARPRRNLMTLIFGVVATHGERRRLADLDDATLRDIGLTREQALREAGRPIWDVPSRWRV